MCMCRLGTASMLTEPGGPFIQLSRLNITKYANQSCVAKPLFEYIYYHEHDARYVSTDMYVFFLYAKNIFNSYNYENLYKLK